jgi:hypothetical protein
VLILDTSFLVELYALPEKAKAFRVVHAKEWFTRARRDRHGLQVPFACILEFGNTITQIKNPTHRADLAAQLAKDFEAAVMRGHQAMWVATDAPQFESATGLLSSWSIHHAPMGRSLVDAAIVRAAAARKAADSAAQVHIWTYDQKLKALEPDEDPAPFPMA